MPTFPHHRNIVPNKKDNTNIKKETGTSSAAAAASNSEISLPAISDLLGTLVKKRRFE